ncbi:hypothetical protein F5Y04DRAFT_284000 [Hypomontagnella monticulosa]|nr:hypothetical protein F5Y04DRAFT_284000 [Hypomontagnella monticulosa]
MAQVPSRVFESPSFSGSEDDDDRSSHDNFELNGSALRELCVPHLQNRPSSASSDSTIDSLTTSLKKLQIDTEAPSNNTTWDNNLKNQGRRRLTRPAITANTFEVLETVLEDEPQRASTSDPTATPSKNQYQFELPASGEEFADHPLVAIARKGIPSAKEQIAKHRGGWFKGLLSTSFPIEHSASEPNAVPKSVKVHFGFNLLPIQDNTEHNNSNETTSPTGFTILVSPLAPGQELLTDEEEPALGRSMALAEPNHIHLAPVKEVETLMADGNQQPTSTSTSPARDKERHMEVINLRSPSEPVARIEDSVEALDKLEEQLEAFDVAAHFREIIPPGAPGSRGKVPVQSLSVNHTGNARSVTPQPKRTTPVKPGSASVRIKATSEPRRSVRKSASMIFLDSPKLKCEDKPLVQAPPRKPTTKGIASLLPPKQPPKPAKKPTIPSFELPGDEVARKLKEKREARASAQAAVEQLSKPTASSLRRAKSAKLPTRPNFELPGEAISRRKREEREAQLKAQEEEERKRREFKARPIRSAAAPSTFPRETAASRARQSKANLVENSAHQGLSNSNKGSSPITNTASRSPLSKTNNQSQPRGRGLHPEPIGMQPSRGTSSSTAGSIGGQRSSVSTEDVQYQRLRGQEIYKQDNSWTKERERERREREALAKLAREEAAERSRQQSREWAAKQAKKRMTIASLRDVMT